MSLKSRVRIKNIELLSKRYYKLELYDLEYQRENGNWQQQYREVYDNGDAATILLYNKDKRTIILVKQLRIPALLNGHEAALIETPAGLLDNMDAAQRMILEVEEEAGYKIAYAEKIYEGFASPGALKQKVHFFIGEYHESDKISSGGGLEDEGEEIEVLELPFDTAMQMLHDGEIQDMKTIILLQHAALKLFI